MKMRFSLRAACLSLAGIMGTVALTTPMLVTQAVAQDTPAATLLADQVHFDGTSLTAQGNVEVFYGDIRLSSGKIEYDRASGALNITGPIRLTDPDGDIVVYADAAMLDADLRNGILTSARLVIDQQLQMASTQIRRVDGRYTQLSKTVTSACQVCESNPVPLWEIRAREVIHDSETRQLYFTDPQFRIAGVPVLYLPHLRLPDPTLDRATGFLIPSLHNSTTLGWGIKVPYFIKMGDHRDLTVAPFLTTETRTVDLQYRQAFANGDITANAALTSDDIEDGMRGYLFVDGKWNLAHGYTLGVDLRATSDIAYLVDYGIYSGDRLQSDVTLSRYGSDTAFDASLITSRTLRASEQAIRDTIPFLLGEVNFEHNTEYAGVPGTFTYGLSASGFMRKSDADSAFSLDAGGLDVLRLGGSADWAHSHIFGSGLRFDMDAGAALDLYAIRQNSNYDSTVARLTPHTTARLSYPLVRTSAGGAHQVLEPFAQIGWAQTYGGDVPNSDSTLIEFDEGNLLALSRFPGFDRAGSGASSALGLRFSSESDRLTYGLTFGRVDEINPTGTTSLSGTGANWLVGGYVNLSNGLDLTTRGIFDDDLKISAWETRFDLLRDSYAVSGIHSYIVADASVGREADINELQLDGSVKLSPYWTAGADIRHDLGDNVSTEAGLSLSFENECTKVKFGAARRYTDTTAVDPDTTYSLTVGFGAFGSKNNTSKRSCGVQMP
ncbi:LPS-assembly protein LptD [Celeribacter sp.]|uniref:LPS-assembly protein LptD n=1 Tax=Celeribacter sp. TaxID=1890673 RepID=UPI003A937DCE